MSRRVISQNEAHRNARDLKRAARRIDRLERTLEAVTCGAVGTPSTGIHLGDVTLSDGSAIGAMMRAVAKCNRAMLATVSYDSNLRLQVWILPKVEVTP